MYFYEVIAAHSFCVKAYTYSSDIYLDINQVVSISFGQKTCLGIVINQSSPIAEYKSIIGIHNYKIEPDFLKFIDKFAKYYFLNIGSVIELCFPSIAFQKSLPILLEFNESVCVLSNLLSNKMTLKEIKKLPIAKNQIIKKNFFDFFLDQVSAINKINSSEFNVCLLEGVTGSGKTVVALETSVEFKNKILILVPEINLASGWVKTIKKRFGVESFVYHSKMSKSFKKSFFTWAISEDSGFIIGTRSALMIPYKNLDYIIIDEEHSTSYRQDSYPYYHARDMAILLGSIKKIKTLLISATPSLETILNIKKNKYDHIKLSRTPKYGLASITYVKGKISEILNKSIIEKVKQRFEKKEQVLFFLNRKGYAPYCACNKCKNLLLCKNCDSAVTLYLGYKIICNKCNQKSILPKVCPSCTCYTTWSFWGLGVQKIHEFLKNTLSSYSYEVVTSESEDIESHLKNIEENKVNGIIATQVLAQGYDFKHIGLVIVVDADMGLISTDFRAMERIYHLWQQIRGRSGRHEIKGEMILQYFKDDNKFVNLFKNDNIIPSLLKERYEEDWPPFSKCAFIKFKEKDKEKIGKQVDEINFNDPSIFGPLFWGVQNNIFEYRFLIKAKTYSILKNKLKKIKNEYKKCEIEVDPY